MPPSSPNLKSTTSFSEHLRGGLGAEAHLTVLRRRFNSLDSGPICFRRMPRRQRHKPSARKALPLSLGDFLTGKPPKYVSVRMASFIASHSALERVREVYLASAEKKILSSFPMKIVTLGAFPS